MGSKVALRNGQIGYVLDWFVLDKAPDLCFVRVQLMDDSIVCVLDRGGITEIAD